MEGGRILVFESGHFRPDLSDLGSTIDGVELTTLANVLNDAPERLEAHLNGGGRACRGGCAVRRAQPCHDVRRGGDRESVKGRMVEPVIQILHLARTARCRPSSAPSDPPETGQPGDDRRILGRRDRRAELDQCDHRDRYRRGRASRLCEDAGRSAGRVPSRPDQGSARRIRQARRLRALDRQPARALRSDGRAGGRTGLGDDQRRLYRPRRPASRSGHADRSRRAECDQRSALQGRARRQVARGVPGQRHRPAGCAKDRCAPGQSLAASLAPGRDRHQARARDLCRRREMRPWRDRRRARCRPASLPHVARHSRSRGARAADRGLRRRSRRGHRKRSPCASMS